LIESPKTHAKASNPNPLLQSSSSSYFLHRIVWCGTKKLPHYLTCLLPLLVSISGICFILAASRRRRRRRRQGQKTEESEREGQAGE
jgi:hypothetical protein